MRRLLVITVVVMFIISASGFETKAQLHTTVSAFIQMYSNSLLSGDYTDHANLFSDPTYFEGKKYSASGIRNVAKNFYSNFITLSHSFDVLDFYLKKQGYLIIDVVEYHKVKNRKTGNITNTRESKRIELIYLNEWWYCYAKYQTSGK